MPPHQRFSAAFSRSIIAISCRRETVTARKDTTRAKPVSFFATYAAIKKMRAQKNGNQSLALGGQHTQICMGKTSAASATGMSTSESSEGGKKRQSITVHVGFTNLLLIGTRV